MEVYYMKKTVWELITRVRTSFFIFYCSRKMKKTKSYFYDFNKDSKFSGTILFSSQRIAFYHQLFKSTHSSRITT